MRVFPLVLLLATAAASAQPAAWLPIPSNGTSVSLTAHKISFDDDLFQGDGGFSAFSSSQFLEVRLGSSNLQAVLDLPTAYTSMDSFGGEDERGFVFGNPYLGLDLALPSERGGASVGLGVRLPLVNTLIDYDDGESNTLRYGLYSAYDRIGAFAPEAATIIGTTTGRYDLTPEVALSGTLSPQVLVPVGDTEFRDAEVLANYIFRAEALAGSALLAAGIRGTGILTQELDDEADRFEHALGIGAELRSGSIRPGAFIELPLNGDTDAVYDFVYGFSLSYRP